MTPHYAVTDRTCWSIAGVDHACSVRDHQAAASSKTQRRNRRQIYCYHPIQPLWPLRSDSRVTPTIGASLKSP